MLIHLERVHHLRKGHLAGLGAHVQENARHRFHDCAKRVEEPAVGVELFRVCFLEAEDHLHGGRLLRVDHLPALCDECIDCQLKDVSAHRIAIVVVGLHESLLIDPHRTQNLQHFGVDLLPSVRHQAHRHLLPRIPFPNVTVVRQVVRDALEGAQELVGALIVHGHDDQELDAARRTPHRVALPAKVLRLAAGTGVPQLVVLLILAAQRVREARRHIHLQVGSDGKLAGERSTLARTLPALAARRAARPRGVLGVGRARTGRPGLWAPRGVALRL